MYISLVYIHRACLRYVIAATAWGEGRNSRKIIIVGVLNQNFLGRTAINLITRLLSAWITYIKSPTRPHYLLISKINLIQLIPFLTQVIKATHPPSPVPTSFPTPLLLHIYIPFSSISISINLLNIWNISFAFACISALTPPSSGYFENRSGWNLTESAFKKEYEYRPEPWSMYSRSWWHACRCEPWRQGSTGSLFRWHR